MDLKYEKKGKTIVVYPDLPFDIDNSILIKKDVCTLIDQFSDYDFIINMTRVEHTDSTGLGMLIVFSKKLESYNRKLKVSNLGFAVKKVYQLFNLDEFIGVYDYEEDAVRSAEISR